MSVSASANSPEPRIGVKATFQGKVKHDRYPLSIGRITITLPDSTTQITLSPPDYQAHDPQPLQFKVKKSEDSRARSLEGMKLTIDKVKKMTMKMNVFEPGPPIGPKILQPDNTVFQQQTLRRSESEIQVKLPENLTPDASYQLQIVSNDGSSATAKLVKVEKSSVNESKKLNKNSSFFKTVSPSIFGLIQLKLVECQLSQGKMYPFNSEVAEQSLLTAINNLPSDKRASLEQAFKTAEQSRNVKAGERALGQFISALNRSQLGKLLEDQLNKAAPTIGATQNADRISRFIDILKNNAAKYLRS